MIDWQAEDEALLADEKQEAGEQKAGKRRKILLFLLIVLLFFLPAGFWGYRQIQAHNRVLARQDVEEQYMLMREAAILRDEALFAERAGTPDLGETDRLLIAEHSWLDREPLGLSWEKAHTPVISVTLSTNGREATLTAIESYTAIHAGTGRPELRMVHSLAFQWENGRWVYTAPVIAAGDEFLVADRPRVRLSYPAGDAETAERLADNFDALVEQVCTALDDMQCPTQFQLGIQFVVNPSSLLNPAAEAIKLNASDSPQQLPTPALVGRPTEETAYAALLDGYAPLVVRTAVARLAGWACCDGQVFFDVLLDQQLRALGLPAGRPANPDFAHLVRKKVRPDDLFGLWGLAPERISAESLDRAQAVVGFMSEQDPEVSVAEWQRRLAAANNYREWAGEVAETNRSPRLRAAWWGYLYSHSGVATTTTTDRPGEDILLLCSSETNTLGEEQLYRFTPEDNALTTAFTGRTFGDAQLFATLDHDVLLLEGLLGEQLQLYALENGAAQPLWESQHAGSRSWFEASPLGNYMFINLYFPDEGFAESSLLDIAACHRGDCALQSLPDDSGPPVWSPDEQHFLFVQNETLYLQAVTEDTREIVLDPPDDGYYDFSWLDNNTYAFSRIREIVSRAGSETIHWSEPHMARIGDEQPAMLFDPADLFALLPVEEGPNWAQLRPHPVDAGRLFVIFEYWDSRTFYVLSLDRGSGGANLLFTAEDADSSLLTLSPDGRWFSFSREGEIVLYDTVSQRTTEIEGPPGVSRPVWSAGSQWFLALSENVLLLNAPATGASHLYMDPDVICSQAVWVPEG